MTYGWGQRTTGTRFGLACPDCQGFGLHEDRTTCQTCDGDGYLSLQQMEAWRARRGDDVE